MLLRQYTRHEISKTTTFQDVDSKILNILYTIYILQYIYIIVKLVYYAGSRARSVQIEQIHNMYTICC